MFYTSQPPKLIDSREHGEQSGAELLVVEGDSASQAVAKQRDGTFQAVLPMQGKTMNPMRATQKKLLENIWYAALVQAIGIGIGTQIKLENRPYERIVLLMDPDADGIHCGALMTLFFYRWMPDLLTQGFVYLVRPPVGHRIDMSTQAVEFSYTVPEFRKLLQAPLDQHYDILKYRGLAGIPQQYLESTCVNPQSRRQIKLGVSDAKMAMKFFG